MPVAIAQNGNRLPRVVVAIVIEENDFASDFSLQPARGLDFCVEEAAREDPARLLTEANDGGRHTVRRLVAARTPFVAEASRRDTRRRSRSRYTTSIRCSLS